MPGMRKALGSILHTEKEKMIKKPLFLQLNFMAGRWVSCLLDQTSSVQCT